MTKEFFPFAAAMRRRSGHPGRQHGVALVVALLLLLVITIVGLAAVRGTIMQQKMASNLFDRQIAFQSAEAAMRAATDRIAANPGDIARNCQAGGVVCAQNPFDDPGLDAASIITVTSGTGTGQFNAGTLAAGQPQYVIENMGNWYNPRPAPVLARARMPTITVPRAHPPCRSTTG